jgi:hypothetical protein
MDEAKNLDGTTDVSEMAALLDRLLLAQITS